MKKVKFAVYLDGQWCEAQATTDCRHQYNCPKCGTKIDFYPFFVAFDGMGKQEIEGKAHCTAKSCDGYIPYKLTLLR